MKKAIVSSLVGILLLVGLGLTAGFHVFVPQGRVQVEKPADPPPAPGEMSWKGYKKFRVVMNSFDLLGGLTKNDLENLRADHNQGFYYLVGCLWVVQGLRILRRPKKRPKPG